MHLLFHSYIRIFNRDKLLTPMLVIIFITCLKLITVNGQQKGDEVCETLPSEIHLIKGDFSIL